VLDFSKIEAGKLDVRMHPCDPRLLVTEICDLMKLTAQRKGLALDPDVAGLPAVICTDAGRLRQCLMNLVGNALKFTQQGYVLIDVEQVERDREDWLITTKPTPNRGDCLSISGIAREVAAATGARLRHRRAAVRDG